MREKLVWAVLLLFLGAGWAQSGPKTEAQVFTRTEVMIAMRDGVHLQTVIFTPRAQSEPLPIILMRSPYGVPKDEKFLAGEKNEALNRDGYIYAVQNIRGRFKSEGTFVMQRPLRDKTDPKAIDEGTDAYDTIDWLVKNVPNNNGRVGMTGTSYDAWLVMMALTDPHPALKAASEQASPDDMFLGDDFHHYGAFRLAYGFEYAAYLESEKDENYHFDFGRYDTYDFYLQDLGPLSNANPKFFRGKLPTWNNFVAHPNRDQFWKSQTVSMQIKHTPVPLLHVAGWWDQEDFYGPQKIYTTLEANDKENLNYFVAGPWNHGGWFGKGDSLGPIAFDSETAKYYRDNILAPWFRHWLHGTGDLPINEAEVFETGSNRWKSYDSWPPKAVSPKKLYFSNGGELSFEAPTATSNAFDTYISDPANPVPYRPRPIPRVYPSEEWQVWRVQDQRFVDHRPDVLTWQTDPLNEHVRIAGDITADLFAATSGTDSDWIVKLIDVYPENFKPSEEQKKISGERDLSGYELMIADEVFRGRFRKSFEKPEAIVPNQPEEYKIDLHTNDHVFQKGHRIMVQVQSTWFPLIDRNPQKFVPNVFQAKQADFTKTTQKIYRSKDKASSILLPVVAN
ncbi:MAG: CocE/NonD family hydrolase [Terriglobales bacterium]